MVYINILFKTHKFIQEMLKELKFTGLKQYETIYKI